MQRCQVTNLVPSSAQVYVESILALQAKAGGAAQLPLAIMTSGDTHARTQALLEDNAYFGMQPGQVTLLKQEKVCCVASPARLWLVLASTTVAPAAEKSSLTHLVPPS
jgi:UDP-N-acetylglucosamine pyrophosphorylase